MKNRHLRQDVLLIFLPFLLLAFAVADSPRHSRLAPVAPAAYDGALMLDESLESQAQRAGMIVIGRVESVTSRKTSLSIESDVAISVDKSLKGNAPKKLTLTLPGGTVNGIRLQVGDVPNFLSGERVLLLLDGSAKPKLLRRWQSKYSLAGTDAYQPEKHSKVSIKSLEDQLGSALKKSVSISQDQTETASIAFQTYCAPWDAGDMPIPFLVNPASPGTGGPSGAGFSRLVYTSWHNWQALNNSYPSFSFAGTTALSGVNTSDGLNVISWGTLDPGVLGENHCAYYLNGPRFDSDTVISNQYTWDADASNGVSGYSLESVLEHELGHGLGMGHSDQTCDGSASTPLMCPAVAAGQRKTILADDSAGAASMYPLSGNAPGAPTTLTAVKNGSTYNLSWGASSGSPLAYDIERGPDTCSGPWVSAGTVPASSTSFADNDFGAGLSGTYCYRVKALGVGGDSGWSNTSQGLPVYGVTWGSHTTPSTMTAGLSSTATVNLTNAGSLTWNASGANPVRVSYHWRNGTCPGSSTAVWDGKRTTLPGDIATGGNVSGLSVSITPPSSPGSYCLAYDVVREGITWFSSQGAATIAVNVTVSAPASVYAVNWNSDSTPSTMNAGATSLVSLNFTNAGSLTWSPSGSNPVRAAYHWKNGACPGTTTAVWDGVRTVLPGDMSTGQSATINASVVAPPTPGTYCLVFDMVREGITWFSTQGAATRQKQVTVQAPIYSVNWGANSTPATMTAGTTSTISVSFTNTGSLTWNASGSNPVRLSYHWRTGACPGTSSAVWDGSRAVLPSDVPQSGVVNNLDISVTAPATPGIYCLVFDMVREGITWFSSQGANVRRFDVTVTAP